MSLGLATGGVAVPVMAWSMEQWGWRATSVGTGVIVLLVGLPLARIILRRPQDHGDYVDGIAPATEPAKGGRQQAADSSADFTAAEALRTRAFWLLGLGHALALLVVSAVNVHAITHMKEGLGYSVTTASWVIMVMTCCQVGGVLMLLGFALLHGVAWGLRGPFMQAMRADYFGRNAIGMILGMSAALIAVGQIGGPMIAGILADWTGNYQSGFTVLAVLSALGSLTFMLITKPVR